MRPSDYTSEATFSGYEVNALSPPNALTGHHEFGHWPRPHPTDFRGQQASGSAHNAVLHVAIGGMQSGTCVIAVERALEDVPGVVAVRVKYPPALAAITFQEEIDASDLKDALKPHGYTLKVVGED